MSMDARTTAALEALLKQELPRLIEHFGALEMLPPGDRIGDVDTVQIISQVTDQLGIIAQWASGTDQDSVTAESASPAAAPPSDSSISDEEASLLLAQMDAPASAAPAPAKSSAEISDDEARRLLAEMDSDAAPAAPAPTKSAAAISDDEAKMLLAEMDSPVVPAAALAPAKAPTPAAEKPHDDHSEDAEDNVEEIAEWDSNQFASDPEMLNDFMTNSTELMESLDQTILALEQNPEDKETIELIFRAAHTLKGAAGMFGFKGIERVMHRMENLFDLVRKGKLVPTADTIDVVFQGIDILRKLIDAVKEGKPSGVKTAPIIKAIGQAAKGKYVKGSVKAAPQSQEATAAPSAQAASAKPAAQDSGASGEAKAKDKDKDKDKEKKKDTSTSTIRVDIERLDALVNLIGELVIDRTRFVTIEEELRSSMPHLQINGNMTETVQLFGRHMNEIQDIIMKVRMVPIGNAINKFPRIVRDLARQLGKQIDLVIEGETTELDKTLVEQIGDPMVHLIRNACDHGIELPDVRKAAGKDPLGKITLSARQEGNQILIIIQDDGKGMDVERIRAKGIERGLIKADQNLTEREILGLIFEAGFSTAEKVTEVSGRGVGMDVVRKQISKLKGLVELSSKLGKGSTITIQLPLTLAIVKSLLVGSRDEVYAIPLSSVIESIRIKPSEIQKVGDSEVIRLRDHVLPLLHLDETLSLDRKMSDSWYTTVKDSDAVKKAVTERRNLRKQERLFVVVVGSANRRYGIVVDQLLNQQEMVIKPIGPLMKSTPCVAGGAVLGNGEVVLVLDIQELDEHFRQKTRGQQQQAA